MPNLLERSLVDACRIILVQLLFYVCLFSLFVATRAGSDQPLHREPPELHTGGGPEADVLRLWSGDLDADPYR